jgi:catechol 2,3-dioxygenase-like lactoylglutathione lyase family enzyme
MKKMSRAGIGWGLALTWLGTGGAAPMPVRPPTPSVSHLAIYAADPGRSERFYVHDLGAAKRPDPEDPRGVRYYLNPTQFVEVLPLPPGGSINRLDHAGLDTPDAEAMRRYLQAKGVHVPATVKRWSDGSRSFLATDPEGNRIEFVQPPAVPAPVPANPLSGHMIHFGFIVHDRAAEDRFYRGLLGFRPYWAGGMKEDKPTWISLQVPDGTDWLEYMVVGTPQGHGIPADMSQANLGVLNHFALGITDARQAYTLLWNNDRLQGQDQVPKIGRDAKWQLNLLDPDGTRAELMELHAIGKPCCSPFTAPDPTR